MNLLQDRGTDNIYHFGQVKAIKMHYKYMYIQIERPFFEWTVRIYSLLFSCKLDNEFSYSDLANILNQITCKEVLDS